MTLNMNYLSDYVLFVAAKNKLIVTNLELQKIMYFTLKYIIKDNILQIRIIKELYSEPFLVWRYGPVVKDIYEKYSIYGADPIPYKSKVTYYPILDSKKGISCHIIHLLHINTFKLVDDSHQEPFWLNNESKIVGWRSNIPYTLYDIKTGK